MIAMAPKPVPTDVSFYLSHTGTASALLAHMNKLRASVTERDAGKAGPAVAKNRQLLNATIAFLYALSDHEHDMSRQFILDTNGGVSDDGEFMLSFSLIALPLGEGPE